MDNLTHSLVGLFLARAGFRHVSPRATAISIVAANVPDIDCISLLGGAIPYLRYHRHITHSLVAIPFMAVFAVFLVWLYPRKPEESPMRWLPAIAVAIVGVVSHILLDLTNVYGVRLLLPWSGAWTHWDLVPVIDFLIWAILLPGVAAPLFNRLLNSELGVKKHGVGAGWAIFSLLLLIGYDWARRDIHEYALGQLESRTYSGLGARRVGAFPLANPLHWEGIAEMSYGYIVVPVDVMQTFDPTAGQAYYKGERNSALEAVRATDPFQHLQEFVQWPVWSNTPAEDGATRVSLMDLRFGRPNQSGFTAIGTVSKSGQVIDSQFALGRFRPK